MKLNFFVTLFIVTEGPTTYSPTCTPSALSSIGITWNACFPNLDAKAWYGITDNTLTFSEATAFCQSVGGTLIGSFNAGMDTCINHAITYQNAVQEVIMMAGRKDTNIGDWTWCMFDEPINGVCSNPFQAFYQNFFNPNQFGDCMGMYYNEFNVGRWAQFDCQFSARAMCRIDCDFYVEPTTLEPPTTTTVTTQEPETTYSPSQCAPNEVSSEKITWNACFPNLDGDAWYGITDEELTYSEAVLECQNAGGHLVAGVNTFLDQCIQHTLDYQNVELEIIMMAGRQDTSFNPNWAWCLYDEPDENGDCSSIQEAVYQNFFDLNNNVNGDCVGMYQNQFGNSAWQQYDCSEKKKAMCRIDCNNYEEPTTTETAPITTVTEAPTTEKCVYFCIKS